MDDPQPFASVDLPDDLLELIKPELAPGERLIWAGKPLGSRDRFLPGFRVALIWAAGFFTVSGLSFAAFFGAFGRRLETIEALTFPGIIAGIIGTLVLTGAVANWVSEGPSRKNINLKRFALTDRRAIIWTPLDRRSTRVDSLQRGKIKDVHRVEDDDGAGSVHFHCPLPNDYSGTQSFIGIADVRRVEELVRRFLIVPEPESSR